MRSRLVNAIIIIHYFLCGLFDSAINIVARVTQNACNRDKRVLN